MKKIAGIYKITSPSGKVYIGQSWDIYARWYGHKRDFRLGRPCNPILTNSFKKHGVDNHRFVILEELGTPPNNQQYNLDIAEQFFIDGYRSGHVPVMNIREAGSRGRQRPESMMKMVATRRANGSYVLSETVKEKYRQAQRGRPGKPHTEATKRLLADLNRGKVQSEETKERNRQSQLGRKHSPETKAKIGAANRGRRRPDLSARNRHGLSPQSIQKAWQTRRQNRSKALTQEGLFG